MSADPHFSWLLVATVAAAVGFVTLVDVLLVLNLRRHAEDRGEDFEVPRGLRIMSLLLPLGAAAALVFTGARDLVQATVPPLHSLEVSASRGEEGWDFRYSPEVAADSLHLPVHRPVRLTLESPEGPLTLKIPALRLERTARAGAKVSAWFEAQVADTFALWGEAGHRAPEEGLRSAMVVHSGPSFDRWFASKSDLLEMYPPVEAGRHLVERHGCLVCHSLDGSPRTGPSFWGVLGRHRVFSDGTTAVADSSYVRHSVLQPQSQIVQGFPGVMPSFEGKLRDADIAAIIDFFETLRENGEEQ